MVPNLFRFSCLFMTMIIVSILSNIPMLQCQENEQYATCGNSFQCGNIRNIGYPFSGQNRPSYCGHPGFQLNCQGSALFITIQSMDYRVLAIDNRTQTLTVARNDMSNMTNNTNSTLVTCDDSLFVPVNQTSAQALANNLASINDLRAALEGGFQLHWAANDTYCNQCIKPGGRCRSNSTSIPQPLLPTALIDLIGLSTRMCT
ncbi:unnamed protein product [Ilex paraguariensis]|uniref:Wall-associated receptor kinase galacturonan-binding domain-containing protein n=1 Tax=Ilex paraguariensis TaxID=185542 RepID=A0ABC8S178_9AQUA